MERQVAEQGHQKKEQTVVKPQNQKQNAPIKDKKETTPQENKTQTNQPAQSTPEKKPVVKKEKATVQGKDLPISYKFSGAICRYIKNKNPEKAIDSLELVIQKRISIPMRGEAHHKKDLKNGYFQGRYPEKAARYFIKLLKSLIANAKTGNLDTEKIIITIAKANKAQNPIRGTRMGSGRKKFKRSHIFIEAREKKTIETHNTKPNTNKESTKSHTEKK